MIGNFLLRDTILIGDPAVCPMNHRICSFTEEQKAFLRVNDIKHGSYFSYHLSSKEVPTLAKEILLLHESIPVTGLSELEHIPVGTVNTEFSGMLFLCEENKAFNALFTYYFLEDGAIYDISELLVLLDNMRDSLPAAVCTSLRSLCMEHTQEGYLLGKDIISTLSDIPLVMIFKQILSSHWSEDIARRLGETPAISIIGGAASNADYGTLPVYKIVKNGEVIGIRARLSSLHR